MRRRRWRHRVIRFGDEKFAHRFRIPRSAGLGEHCADEEADHVMEKAIGLDVEREATLTVNPARFGDGATVGVSGRGSAAHREGDEPVLADKVSGGKVKRLTIERMPVRPFGRSPKGRVSLVICTDLIGIPPGRRAEASMELGTHLMRRRDPHIVREECVEGAPEIWRGPLLRHSHTDRLPARVYARVGTAGSLSHYPLSTEFGEHSLDFALNGPLFGLDLPAGEGGPVIVQHELHSARRHQL